MVSWGLYKQDGSPYIVMLAPCYSEFLAFSTVCTTRWTDRQTDEQSLHVSMHSQTDRQTIM